MEIAYFLLGITFSAILFYYKFYQLSRKYQKELQLLIEKDNQLLSGWTELTKDFEKAIKEKGIIE